MRLYGIWVAQNEADVIRDTLEFHRNAGLFERIFFYDLGSTDDTLAIARQYSGVVEVEQRRVPYSGKLRVALIDEHRDVYQPGDWVAIIDSDEIYADDPIDAIGIAEAERATRLETWQAQFYFTDRDLASWERGDAAFRSTPAFARLQHYVINWSEMRFYKYLPEAEDRRSVIDLEGKLASVRVLNRHYPYRSPDQIADKVKLRLENRRVGGNPQYQIFSDDWAKYVVDHRVLHRHDGRFRFGVPTGVDWKHFYNFWANDSTGWKSPAYNNVYIYWLMEHGFLRAWSVPELALKAMGKAVQKVRRRELVARF
jgi:glycosyltransferase involved in cell wall biosynthesis